MLKVNKTASVKAAKSTKAIKAKSNVSPMRLKTVKATKEAIKSEKANIERLKTKAIRLPYLSGKVAGEHFAQPSNWAVRESDKFLASPTTMPEDSIKVGKSVWLASKYGISLTTTGLVVAPKTALDIGKLISGKGTFQGRKIDCRFSPRGLYGQAKLNGSWTPAELASTEASKIGYQTRNFYQGKASLITDLVVK